MSRSLVRWRVRELLVLDNRLRASVRQPRSFGGSGADFCSQHKGSDWSRLGALVVRWNRVGYRSLDEASAREHSLFTRPVGVFDIGCVCRILFPIPLFYSGSTIHFAACWHWRQHSFGSIDRPRKSGSTSRLSAVRHRSELATLSGRSVLFYDVSCRGWPDGLSGESVPRVNQNCGISPRTYKRG